eukprot:TRINITY_DN82982_c0_g1_i5.p1 TRINITY_DN82982_c0_g1~~TRINITY_DN82982_c0_g1_i5.p1  ORF type:complete len:1008 (+),score=211.04 TRINITY_DN82982_c0_g1_i5:126-3026(+)
MSIPQESSEFKPMHVSTPTRASRQEKQKHRPLRVLNVNFHSAVGKRAEIFNLIESTKPDIIIGTETWMDSGIKDSEVFPDQYTLYRRDRNREGGGVLVAVRDSLKSAREPELETMCEIIWIRIHTKERKTLYVCAYYRPNLKDAESLHQFDISLRRARLTNANLLVAGDLNFPGWEWSSMTLKKGTKYVELHRKLADLLNDTGMEQVVHEPTREENTLDLVMTNSPHLIPRVNVIPGLSDHDIVFCEFQTKVALERQPQRQIPLYQKAEWDSMRSDMNNLQTKVLEADTDTPVEELWSTFKDGLHSSIKDNIPHKLSKSKPKPPWLTAELRHLIRKRDKVYKKMKKTASPDLRTQVNALRRDVQRELRRAHWNYIGKLFEQREEESTKTESTKRFWTYVKHQRSSRTGIPPLKVNGCLVTDSKEKAQTLNEQFNQAFSDGKTYSEEEFYKKCSMTYDASHYPTISDITISEQGVKLLLTNLNPGKASGPDNISPRVLKELSGEIAPILTTIYTASLQQGTVPKDWREAIVTPIFKKGEHYEPSNYRPVSLTSVPCKVMEHIVVSHLMKHLESNQILSPRQHGFRKHRSCETQLLEFSEQMTETMETGLQSDVIVMDFAKAFDKVNHSLLCHKLKHYGVRGQLNTWIRSLLQDRRQAVVVNGTTSDFIRVKSGVPQGSVVGPSLFLAYINDLPEKVESDSRLFADDTLLHRNITSPRDQGILQEDLHRLEDWENQWDMSFHPKKCNVLNMTRCRTVRENTYSLHDHKLETASSTKYLGVTVQNNGSWDAHIDAVAAKANRTLGFVRRNLRISSITVKEMAYKSLVRPILEYASTVWDPHQKNDIDKLEAVQRRAARFALNRHRNTSSVGNMLNKLKWPKLQQRRKTSRLAMLYKIRHNLAKVETNNLTPHTRRGRGHNQAYRLPSCRTDYRKYSFLPRTIKEWNSLPAETVTAPSLETFVSRVSPRQ